MKIINIIKVALGSLLIISCGLANGQEAAAYDVAPSAADDVVALLSWDETMIDHGPEAVKGNHGSNNHGIEPVGQDVLPLSSDETMDTIDRWIDGVHAVDCEVLATGHGPEAVGNDKHHPASDEIYQQPSDQEDLQHEHHHHGNPVMGNCACS